MSSKVGNKDQQHPQYQRDREIVSKLMQGEPNDHNLAELARLIIRYCDFPGARDIQRDLETVLQKWQLPESELFEKTRQLHTVTQLYKVRNNQQEQEDWT
jgi:hypothetical protein